MILSLNQLLVLLSLGSAALSAGDNVATEASPPAPCTPGGYDCLDGKIWSCNNGRAWEIAAYCGPGCPCAVMSGIPYCTC